METKAWYTSKTVWGGLLAILSPLIGSLFHVSVSDSDITQISDILSTIGTSIGGLLAVYGRIKATTKVNPTITGN